MAKTFHRLSGIVRPFGIGLLCGAAIGAALMWKLDWRASPSIDLRDARRAAQSGKWEIVRSVASRHLQRFPEDPEGQILLARSLASQNDFAGCLKTLENVRDDSEWSAEARLREAQAHLMNHFGARAEQSYSRSIELANAGRGNQQVMDAARFGLIQLYGLEVRYDEARLQLRQVLQTTDNPAAVLSLFLQIESLGTEPNQAIESLQRFVQNDESDFEARRALGHHLVVTGQLDAARPHLEACFRERPKDMRVAESHAQLLVDTPDFESCRKFLDSIEPVAQGEAWFWRQRGYLSEQELDWNGALECYDRAVQLAPHDAMLHHRLAAVLRRVRQEERAGNVADREALLKAARQKLPDLYAKLIATGVQAGGPGPDPDLCYAIGSCCLTLGLAEANYWFHEALARDPNHAPSRSALEKSLAAEQNP
jgi:tetratricopeptide (TPR) repeat protein